MQINRLTSVAIIVATSFSTVAIGEARAQSAASTETEIAALKRQLLLMEQKLEALQKQTAANTTAAAKANAKADAKVAVTSANPAIPIKTAVAPSDVVVTMPGNRPTICTADNLNCVAITSRVHFDGGGYDYRPNTAATVPQRLDDGVNVRSALGARWYTDQFWAGAYVTGPTTGAIHSASSINPPGTTEQYGTFARVAGQVVSGKDYSLHIGGDAEWLIQPPHNLIAGTQTLTLSDRPEVRIDPTTLVSTGALPGVSGAQVYSAEAAGTYGPLFFQGEYFWFNVDRNAFAPLPSLKFQGGYAEAAYVLTGETRPYNSASATYGGIAPENPFSLTGGGWGAWEVPGRYSTIDPNDRPGLATGRRAG